MTTHNDTDIRVQFNILYKTVENLYTSGLLKLNITDASFIYQLYEVQLPKLLKNPNFDNSQINISDAKDINKYNLIDIYLMWKKWILEIQLKSNKFDFKLSHMLCQIFISIDKLFKILK